MAKYSAGAGHEARGGSSGDDCFSIYKAFFETAPMYFWIKDTQNRILKISKKAAELHGKEVEEIEGKSLETFLPKDISWQFLEEDKQIIRSKNSLRDIIHSFPVKDTGKTIILQFNKTPLIDHNGNVTHIFITGIDITRQKESEESLKKSEAHSKALLSAIPDLLFVTDKNGIFSDFKASKDLLFVKPEKIIGQSISAILPPDVAEKGLHYIKEAYKTKEMQAFEYSLNIRGNLRFFEARISAYEESIITLVKDISEQKKAENELVKSEASYKELRNKIMQTLSDALVAAISLDDFYALVQSSLSQLIPADNLYIGLYNEKDRIFTCSYCAWSENNRGQKIPSKKGILDYTMKSEKPVLLTKEEFTSVIRNDRIKYAEEIPAYWIGVPMKTGKDLIGIVTLYTHSEDKILDSKALELVTLASNLIAVAVSKKITEERLAQQLDFLNSLMENFPHLIYVKDIDSKFLRVSKSFAKRLHIDNPDELIGKSDFDIFEITHAQEAFDDEQEIIRTGIPLAGKDELETWPSGERGWCNSSKMAWHNADGKTMGTFGISFDITERKHIEEELQKNQMMLETVLNSIPQSVFWKDGEGKYMGCNKIFAKMAGFDHPLQIIGKSDFDLPWSRKETDHYRADDAEVFHSGKPKNNIIETIRQADGREIWIDTSKVPLMNENGVVYGVLGIFQDITDRRNAETALLESRRKIAEANKMLKLIINTIPTRVFWKDTESVFIGCNASFAGDAGHSSPEELIGKTDYDMPWEEQAENYCRDDKEVMETAIAKMNYEEEQTTPEGHRIWLLTSKVPLRDLDDEIIGVLGTYDNITLLKEKEEELKSKNEELERFTYTVSHDLKSPLVTIKGFVGLLEEDIESGDAENVRMNIFRIKSAADKMSNLLNNLLELSRIGRFNNPFTKVSMRKLVKETLDSLSGIIQRQQVMITIPESMPEVYADVQRITEVWQNLIENSVKFMGDQPKPAIEIGYSTREREVEFFIRDNGIGIDPKYFDTIFGLFNKLDNKSEGTGFGLALVKRVIEVHGGTIYVESGGIGHGATFRFTLPVKKQK